MELENGLKDVFYDKSSSAASSDARIPLLNADGTPKGSDTMSNMSKIMAETLLKAGYEPAKNKEEAEIYILNSCAVTHHADNQRTHLCHCGT